MSRRPPPTMRQQLAHHSGNSFQKAAPISNEREMYSTHSYGASHFAGPNVGASDSSSRLLLGQPVASSSLLLRNTTPHDRRIMAKKALLQRLRQERDSSLIGADGVVRPYFWRSPLVSKEKRLRLMLVQHSSVYPVLARHLAARMIQHWWHRFTPSERRKRSALKIASAAAQRLRWTHPYTHWQKLAHEATQTMRIRRPTLASAYFLETGMYATHLGAASSASPSGSFVKSHTAAYKDWCSAKIARTWLTRRTSRRYRAYALRPVYTYAAIDIQRCYREFVRRRAERGDPHAHMQQPAAIIQRAYRRFTQRRIYQYFRDLILARQNSNPYLLLKLLNPREAGGHDHASGLYLRFRLGGSVFPPILYYKTFTNLSVTDIGAFAPRDYARDRKLEREKAHLNGGESEFGGGLHPTDRAYWYRRYENNGWRPIVNDSLLVERDPVCERTSATRVAFHPSKVVRRLDALRKRKGRKIEWLRKLYTNGVIALPTAQQLAEARGDEYKEDAAYPHPDDDADSDEEEWAAWKTASAARLHGGGVGGASLSPEEMLARLESVDVSDPRAVLHGDWEEEAADLLDWCAGLGDFEAYNDAWLVTATSRPNDKEYRMYDAAPATATEPVRPASSAAGAAATAAVGGAASAVPPISTRTSKLAPARATAASSVHVPSTRSVTIAPSHSASQRGFHSSLQLSSSTAGFELQEALAREAAAESFREAAAEENEGLPQWIAQTASRAQLASLQAAQSLSQSSLRSPSASSSQQSLGATRDARRMSPPANNLELDVTQAAFPVQVKLTPSRGSRRQLGAN